MSGWMWEAEEEPSTGVRVQLQPQTSPRTPSPGRSNFLDAAPTARTSPLRQRLIPKAIVDSDDSDGDNGLEGRSRAVSSTATHVVLRVKHIAAISASETEQKNRLDPGRLGMAHFIDCSPVVITPATMCVIHADEAPPFEARPKRCIADRTELTAVSDGQRELRWENGAGEVRVKLKPGATSVRAALVVGTEVVGLTGKISLSGPMRRFFDWHSLHSPESEGDRTAETVGKVRLALELWPPGSTLFDQAAQDAEGDMWLTGKPERHLDPDRASCGFCDGAGRKMCQGCFGHGILVCTACDGTPTIPCVQCKGTGNVVSHVEVLGSRNRSATSGTGRRCTACWGSSISCTTCFGMGGLRCGGCSGTGWKPCFNCIHKTGAEWY